MNFKDITPHNVRNFIEGYTNFVSTRLIPKHHLEQYMYRAWLCRECLANGRCIKCGCATPAMFFAPKKKDSLDKWPRFMEMASSWTVFKEENTEFKKFKELLQANEISLTSKEYLDFVLNYRWNEVREQSSDERQDSQNAESGNTETQQ